MKQSSRIAGPFRMLIIVVMVPVWMLYFLVVDGIFNNRKRRRNGMR